MLVTDSSFLSLDSACFCGACSDPVSQSAPVADWLRAAPPPAEIAASESGAL